MYEIIFRTPAEKALRKLDNSVREDLLKKIKKLGVNPEIGKPLSGNLAGLWRLRYDKYRIIYKIKNQELVVLILDICHRKSVY